MDKKMSFMLAICISLFAVLSGVFYHINYNMKKEEPKVEEPKIEEPKIVLEEPIKKEVKINISNKVIKVNEKRDENIYRVVENSGIYRIERSDRVDEWEQIYFNFDSFKRANEMIEYYKEYDKVDRKTSKQKWEMVKQ